MDETNKDALDNLVFAEKKVITDLTVARHLDISVQAANKLLIAFYNLYKDEIHAVYAVSGEQCRAETNCEAVILAKETNLDEVKATFTKIDNVALFAIHKDPLQDISSILAFDIIEDEKFFRGDARRAAIKTIHLELLHEEMEEKYKVEVAQQKILTSENTSNTATREMKKDVKTAVKTQILDKKISNMFQKNFSEKTPKNSPKKIHDSSITQTSPADLSTNKRRNRKILIDSEDEITPAKKHKAIEAEKLSPKTKVVGEKTMQNSVSKHMKSEKSNFDNDLYEAESPEKQTSSKAVTPIKMEKKRKVALKTTMKENGGEINDPPIRRSPRKIVANEPASKKKVMKKETETFMDEDGFLVTKTVLKEIEVDENEEERKLLSPKETLLKSAPVNKNKKAAPASQAKISSFFNKK